MCNLATRFHSLHSPRIGLHGFVTAETMRKAAVNCNARPSPLRCISHSKLASSHQIRIGNYSQKNISPFWLNKSWIKIARNLTCKHSALDSFILGIILDVRHVLFARFVFHPLALAWIHDPLALRFFSKQPIPESDTSPHAACLRRRASFTGVPLAAVAQEHRHERYPTSLSFCSSCVYGVVVAYGIVFVERFSLVVV